METAGMMKSESCLTEALWMYYFTFLPEVNWPQKKINLEMHLVDVPRWRMQGCPFRFVSIVQTNQVPKTNY